MKSNNQGRPFMAVAMAVVLLAALSLVPWNRLTNGVLKDFNLLSQIFADGTSELQATATEPVDPGLEHALAELDEEPEAAADTAAHDGTDDFYDNFSVPVSDGKVMMEDYTRDRAGAVNLRAALARGRKARIAVIGDSYIEGDIFTQHVREMLQKRLGGSGVGYMPMYSELTGFRTSVRQTCRNWKESDIRKAGGNRFNWLAGEYFVAEPGASTTFSGSSRLAGLSSWDNTRILYLADEPGSISIGTDSGEYRFEVSPSEDVAVAEVPGTTSTASVTTTVPGLVVLGAFLDGTGGIQVDNMSLRGNSGLTHRKLNIDLAARMRAYVDYDMVVIEYGINALTSQQKEYSGYSRILGQIIDRVRQCYPDADIVMMGIGDRGQKINGNVASLPTAPAMVRAQRDAARRKGVIFWDTRAAMGGENSVVDWRDRGLINADYIHLNAKGGKELARLFVDALDCTLYPPSHK